MPPKAKKTLITTIPCSRFKSKSKAASKSKTGPGRSASGVQIPRTGSHDGGLKKRSRPPVSKPRAGYTLYSSDSEERIGEVDKGLNRCASIVKQMLEVRKGVGKVPKGDLKMVAPPSSKPRQAVTREIIHPAANPTHSPKQLNQVPVVIPTADMDESVPQKRGPSTQQPQKMMVQPRFNKRLATSTPDPDKMEPEDTGALNGYIQKTATSDHSRNNTQGIPTVKSTGTNQGGLLQQLLDHDPRQDRSQSAGGSVDRQVVIGVPQGAGLQPLQFKENLNPMDQRSGCTTGSAQQYLQPRISPRLIQNGRNTAQYQCQAELSEQQTGSGSGVHWQTCVSQEVKGGPVCLNEVSPVPQTYARTSDIQPGMENFLDESEYQQLPSPQSVFQSYKGISSRMPDVPERLRQSEGFFPVVTEESEFQKETNSASSKRQVHPRELSESSDLQPTPKSVSRNSTNGVSQDGLHDWRFARIDSSKVSSSGCSLAVAQPINSRQLEYSDYKYFHPNQFQMETQGPCFTGGVGFEKPVRESGFHDSPGHAAANSPAQFFENSSLPVVSRNGNMNDMLENQTYTLPRQDNFLAQGRESGRERGSQNTNYDGHNEQMYYGPPLAHSAVNRNVAQSSLSTNVAQSPMNTNMAQSPMNTNMAQSTMNTNMVHSVMNTNMAQSPMNTNMAHVGQRAVTTDLAQNQNGESYVQVKSVVCDNRGFPGNQAFNNGPPSRHAVVDNGRPIGSASAPPPERLPLGSVDVNIRAEMDRALQPLIAENSQLRSDLRMVNQQLKDFERQLANQLLKEKQRESVNQQSKESAVLTSSDQETHMEVLEWTQNKVKTLEQALHEEQCRSDDLQAELRQCQRDLDQYKTDRQKLLVAIAEKDADKLRARQENQQEVNHLHAELQMQQKQCETYRLKLDASEKESHILAISLKQRDSEINRLQELVQTMKKSMSELIQEQSHQHDANRQLSGSFNLQRLERLLRDGNLTGFDIERLNLHDDRSAPMESSNGHMPLEPEFAELTMDALAEHNERSTLQLRERSAQKPSEETARDKQVQSFYAKDQDLTNETSESSTTTIHDLSSVSTVKELSEVDSQRDEEASLKPHKKVHFDLHKSGNDGSLTEVTDDGSTVVSEVPSRYSVTDYFRKYPGGVAGSSLLPRSNHLGQNKSLPAMQKSVKCTTKESVSKGKNSEIAKNQAQNSQKILQVPNKTTDFRRTVPPLRDPFGPREDDVMSLTSGITFSSVSTLATVDESVFREGLANLDANIARLQESLSEKKALLLT
ncbi:uncharacterized protein LOC135464460 [Liolophura sinensis]|uniref:uncharacterized protein LOC135464460 n=1 Tax=Liolophura sinensis TaxID=3198878 RepID=UPI003158FA84